MGALGETGSVLDVDDGLPDSAEGWPEGLLEKLTHVSQGDVIGSMPLIYLAAPETPVWARTRDYSDDFKGIIPVVSDEAENPRYFMVTSQTCDIVESAGERPNYPWVQAAPVFDMSGSLNSGQKKLLKKRGWRRWLWHLPALEGGFWVADLRIEVPIEKGTLAPCEVISGHTDEDDRRSLGHRLASRRSRPAFADPFVSAVQAPLVSRLRDLSKSDEELYAAMDPAVGVYVAMDNHLKPKVARIVLICDEAPPTSVVEWWNAWWDDAHQAADEIGLALLPLEFREASAMTLKEFRQYTLMPLDRVSPD